jgi:prepilin-type N-terminal cleavage/methylation domain-containing protein
MIAVTHTSIPHSRNDRKRKGFTLTEIAIVLGIIGLILGAIWTAASSVYSNQKISKANTELLSIAGAVRNTYANSLQSGYANSAALTGGTTSTMTIALCNAGAFPTDIVVVCATPEISDPWAVSTAAGVGTVLIPTSITGTQDGFAIAMTGVPKAACANMLANVGNGAFFAGVGASLTAAGWTAGTTASNLPIPATTAVTTCAGATNNVYFVFKLKG